MAPSYDQQTDGALLEAFVLRRDEAAFARIERRHGAGVLCACRRMLGRSQDAEDAAQAAFIALATKAASLTGEACVAAWLHHVAWCACIDFRRQASTRARYEREAMATTSVTNDDPDDDHARIAAVFDEALASLPEKFRLPVILHHLQNHGHETGADLMGCKVGTFASRLSRGREMLRGALRKRGVALPLTVLMAFLSRQATASDLPPATPQADPTALSRMLAEKPLPTVMNTITSGSGAVPFAAWAVLVASVIAAVVATISFLRQPPDVHSGTAVAETRALRPLVANPVIQAKPQAAPTLRPLPEGIAIPAAKPPVGPAVVVQAPFEVMSADKRRTLEVKDTDYLFAGLHEPTRMPILELDQGLVGIGTLDESILSIDGKPARFHDLIAGERVFVRWKMTVEGPRAIALVVERSVVNQPEPTVHTDF